MGKYKKYLKVIYSCFFVLSIFLMPEKTYGADRNFNQTADISIAENEDYVHTKQYTWCAYKAPDHGYITITAGNGASAAAGNIRLYDSKKQTALSGNFSYHTAGECMVTYGVKKNTIYYIQINAQGAAVFNCKFTKIKENSGSKKSGAKFLKKKQLAKGILEAGSQKADWYKIKLTKKQVLNFYYSGKTNGKIRFTFSGIYLKTSKRYVTRGGEAVNRAYSAERVQPGIYYVKIEPANVTSSGYYTLKWE